MIYKDRVGLRAIENGDLEQLRQWRNDPEYRIYFREHREISAEAQLHWFENVVLPCKNSYMFSITFDDELVGCAGLVYVDTINRNADLSIYIGKDRLYIDDEIAPKAANLLIEYAFQELNLHKLWTEVYSIDNKKQHFFEKILNFEKEGVLSQHHYTCGKWVDSIFYGRIKCD